MPSNMWWRRRADSNRRVKVLQTSPLPLGYGATKKQPRHQTQNVRTARHHLKDLCPSAAGTTMPRSHSNSPSGKRDSNPRHQPWQGCALPTELFPQLMPNMTINISPLHQEVKETAEGPRPVKAGSDGRDGRNSRPDGCLVLVQQRRHDRVNAEGILYPSPRLVRQPAAELAVGDKTRDRVGKAF